MVNIWLEKKICVNWNLFETEELSCDTTLRFKMLCRARVFEKLSFSKKQISRRVLTPPTNTHPPLKQRTEDF